MKVSVEEIAENEEEEVIIRCYEINEEVMDWMKMFKNRSGTILGAAGEVIHRLSIKDIYYFESVDNRTYIYGKDRVYESKQKLYELEEVCAGKHFFRASKSTILNAAKIESIRPILSGRFEANLKNGEKVIISRQYVPVLKKILGM